jgi:MFS family permease
MTDASEPAYEPGGGKLRRAVRAVVSDVTPLRIYPRYRRLWLGEVAGGIGGEATYIAILMQVYTLTRSPAAVGLLGLVAFVPLMLGTTIGGPLIDRYNRRTILVIGAAAHAAVTALLLANALAQVPSLTLVYVGSALLAFVSGIDVPARQATTPVLVDKEHLQAAISLNNVMWSVSSIAGPALGGLIIGTMGLSATYGLGLAAALLTSTFVWLVGSIPPVEGAAEKSGWESLKEGLRFLKGRRVLNGTFQIDLFAMVFGLPEALFPVLAVTRFGEVSEAANPDVITGGPVVGALLASVAVGALIASLTTGWTHRIKHQGQAVVWMVVVWGAAITVFGFSMQLWVACLLLAIAGGADTISAVFRGTILQTSLTEDIRGRITSIHFFVVAGGPRLGNLESGLVAQWTSPAFAVISGGLLCIAGAIGVAMKNKPFWRYHAGDDT